MHEFSCMHNAVSVHVTWTVVTVYAICEGLKETKGISTRIDNIDLILICEILSLSTLSI